VTGTRKQRLAVGLAMQLLLVALVLAIVALGNRTWSRGFVIYVDFDRLDNLKEGAEVRISGQAVGRVLAIGSGAVAGEPPRRAALRTRLWIERDLASLVRRSSVFYLSAKGVIGERYLEVGPSAGEPLAPVEGGEVYRGVDPPMLDRLIQKGYANLRATLAIMHELRPEPRELGEAIEKVRGRLSAIAQPERLRRLRDGLEATVAEAQGLIATLRVGTDGGRLPRKILRDLEAVGRRRAAFESTGRKLAALQDKGEELAALLSPAERERVARSLERLQRAAAHASAVAHVAEKLARRVERGRGTVGRFLTDTGLHDEIKEAHRVLKESPWRAIARPPRESAPRGVPKRKAE